MSGKPSRPEDPDISFSAEVRAKELRFHDAPGTSVEFNGSPGLESGSGSDRRNLPQRVRAAVTYRDVQVDYRLAARLGGRPGDHDRTPG